MEYEDDKKTQDTRAGGGQVLNTGYPQRQADDDGRFSDEKSPLLHPAKPPHRRKKGIMKFARDIRVS